MAQMIPESLSSRATSGEKRVFEVLQRLPDDCVVYYEAFVNGRYPDFIVIMPSAGVLVIEVKDWYIGNIEKIDNNNVVVKGEQKAHPLRQARDYMFGLCDACKVPEGQALTGKNGRFTFPVAHMVILSNIDRRALMSAGNISKFFQPTTTMTRDELSDLKDCSGAELVGHFVKYFTVKWPVSMTPKQVDILRGIISPVSVITGRPLVIDVGQDGRITVIDDETLQVLDILQERQAKHIGDGHRLLFGVAGSGKTVILIARAKLLASTGKRILVTCFNKALAEYLKSCLKDYAKNVTVKNFHALGTQDWKVPFNPNYEEFGNSFLDKIRNTPGAKVAKYDAIFVDEAQDFDSSWFCCLVMLLKDRANGDLLIVGDGMQGINNMKKGNVSWSDLGISAVGRTKYLERDYRNSAEIVLVASAFSGNIQASDGDGVEGVRLDANSAVRKTGIRPLLIKEEWNMDKLINDFVAITRDLLAGKFHGETLSRALTPNEIAIVYPARKKELYYAIPKLCNKLSKITQVQNIAQNKHRVLLSGIKISTIHAIKGLQYKAVLVFGAETVEYITGNDNTVTAQGLALMRTQLMYVALTRAEDILVVGYVPLQQGSKIISTLEQIADNDFMWKQ